MKSCVIGAGSWGTAFAHLLASTKGKEIGLWANKPEITMSIRNSGINPNYLADYKLNTNVKGLTSEQLSDYDIYFIAIPVQHVREVMSRLSGLLNNKAYFVSLSKGIEISTFKRPTEVLSEVLRSKEVASLVGPSHAEEVIRLLPTSVVVASPNEQISKIIQEEATSSSFRVYRSGDLTGVEISSAVKNVIAIAAGITKGLGLGDNAVSSMVTRGIAEIARFILFYGGNRETIYGLAGIGDLMTTCFSRHSRNLHVGNEIAAGKKLNEITDSMKQVPEGVFTVKAIKGICDSKQIEMPISAEVYEILYNGKDPLRSLKDLMSRPLKQE